MARELVRLSPKVQHVLVVHNRTAGSGRGQSQVQQLASRLEGRQLCVELVDRPAQLAEAVQRVGVAQVRAVVAAGGDGTVAAAVHHVPARTPLTIFPLGTENLLAKYLGIPRHIDWLVNLILDGRALDLDLGEANGREFLLMAGCGFDAEVVRRVAARRQGHIQHWSYAKPIFDTLRSYQYPALRVYCQPVESGRVPGPNGGPADGTPWAVARWVFVVNLPRYARGLQFAPAAVGTDDLLDVVTFRRGSWWQGARYLAQVWSGRHLQCADVQSCQTRTVRIESDIPVPYQLDGDPGGDLPLVVRSRPAGLRVLVSAAWAARHETPGHEDES